MIHFIRTIRRQLLDSGSLRKYLTYALGEILLVVIGILVAMQINNWNETRKLNARMISALNEVKEDLIKDTIELNQNIKLQELDLAAQKRIIHVLEKKQSFTENEYRDLGRVELKREVTLIRNGFDLLKEIGLSNMNDETLRNALTTYYGKNQVEVRNEIDDDKYEFEDFWIPYIRQHFKEWNFGQNAFPFDDQEINNDRTLLTEMKINLNNRNGAFRALEAAMSTAEKLIQLINKKTKYDPPLPQNPPTVD